MNNFKDQSTALSEVKCDHESQTQASMNETEENFENLDLSHVISDPSSPLHALTTVQFNRPEVLMSVCVIDLANVSITLEAKLAIKRAHYQPLYFVEAYARHYSENLLLELTRGLKKGKCVLDPSASTYEHTLSSGQAIVVHGKTVEAEEAQTRKLTISVKPINSTGASE